MNQILLVSGGLRHYQKYCQALECSGFTLSLVDSSPDTWKALLHTTFDLLVVDVTKQTPELDPWRLCVELAKATTISLVIIMRPRHNQDLLTAHRLGTKQCLTSPVSLRDLKGCFTAVCSAQPLGMRSLPLPTIANYEDPAVQIDFVNLQIRRGDLTFSVTRMESALLYKLVSEAGRVVPLKTLREEVWSEKGTPGSLASLKNCILRLRRKIEPDAAQPRYIISHFGYGYRFAPRVPEAGRDPKEAFLDSARVTS